MYAKILNTRRPVVDIQTPDGTFHDVVTGHVDSLLRVVCDPEKFMHAGQVLPVLADALDDAGTEGDVAFAAALRALLSPTSPEHTGTVRAARQSPRPIVRVGLGSHAAPYQTLWIDPRQVRVVTSDQGLGAGEPSAYDLQWTRAADVSADRRVRGCYALWRALIQAQTEERGNLAETLLHNANGGYDSLLTPAACQVEYMDGLPTADLEVQWRRVQRIGHAVRHIRAVLPDHRVYTPTMASVLRQWADALQHDPECRDLPGARSLRYLVVDAAEFLG